MSSASMTFGRPTRVTFPRGSLWLGSLAAMLIAQIRRFDRWQLDRGRDEPRNAEQVMAWAQRIERTEPGFAADLRAAALRSISHDDQ